ncbi:MAG: hypothetical protein JJT75_14125 [Opitutales bacterium]|nr:hypothetical protein [Opitutales bacterium]MCH8539741.1 hypothetical protein [Opitutales bacterium]
MDNQTAKEILSAYRANGEDASDPLFQEALEHCRRDPEMQKWLEQERLFDREMTQALTEVRAPADGLQSILATLPMDKSESSTGSPFTRAITWGAGLAAIAAAIIFAVVLGTQYPSPEITPIQQATFSMPQLVEKSVPLDFRSRDATEMIQWLQRHGAPVPKDIPTALLSRQAAGCRIFQDENGHKISLLCFEHEGKPVHLFVFEAGAANDLLQNLPHNDWWQESDWNFYRTDKNEQTIAIASQLNPDRLANLL